ncbi:MAG: hypothetical protein HFF90_12020 [Oscillibacter sp.]|nr:hypothetical protein [Oscillibacter sp.]
MAEMKDFCLWFLNTMPAILLKPPISAFVGLALLLVVLRVIRRMMML